MALKDNQRQNSAIIYPLVSNGSFELLPSSEIEQTILYRDHRLKCMLNIASFVRACLQAKRPAAIVEHDESNVFNGFLFFSDWFKPFIPVFDDMAGIDLGYVKDFTLCEEIMSFFSAKELLNTEIDLIGVFESPNSQPLVHIQTRVDLLNKLVQLVREQMNNDQVQIAVKKRERMVKANFKSCRNLINQYFATHSKLLVIRLDFAFTPSVENLSNFCPDELQHPFHSEMTLQSLKEQIKRLLGNRRHNKILRSIKGYILKFEHGLKKGFHVHAMFFIDGNLHQNDSYFAHEITKYWKKLTDSKGCTYNCHMAKDKYKTLCIGIIDYTDTAKRKALDVCVNYFCKKEQFFMFSKIGQMHKTLQKSEAPKKFSNAGRPRKGLKAVSIQTTKVKKLENTHVN